MGWRGTRRPNLSRETNSPARTGTGKLHFFPCSADHEQDWEPWLRVTSLSGHEKLLRVDNVYHRESAGRTSRPRSPEDNSRDAYSLFMKPHGPIKMSPSFPTRTINNYCYCTEDMCYTVSTGEVRRCKRSGGVDGYHKGRRCPIIENSMVGKTVLLYCCS